MTDHDLADIESVLRRDLPDLADALVAGATHGIAPTERARTARWRRLAVAAAVMALVVAGAIALRSRSTVVPAAAPASYGTWSAIPEAPIEPRLHAATGWIDGKAVFWAGSSQNRGMAYSDAASYDPVAGTWRMRPVPGFGHPGARTAVRDGEFWFVAKGGIVRYDPGTGETTDVTAPGDVVPVVPVAHDGEMWVIGFTGWSSSQLTITRWDAVTEAWEPAIALPETLAMALSFEDLLADADVLAVGDRIVVWSHDGYGAGFDTVAAEWSTVLPPVHEGASIARSVAAVADGDLVLAAAWAGTEPAVDVGRLVDGGWQWSGLDIPVTDPASITVAAAGEWLVVFSTGDPPAVVHVPSATWQRDPAAPVAGVSDPNTVWTGAHLVVWGGEGGAADGAVWNP